MPALARNQASNCTNPTLDVFTQVNGVLVDVNQLEFQIFDVSDAIKQVTPLQVFPATVGARAAVDVTTLCPGGGKLSTGHFVADWTPPVGEPLGTHEIRWFFKLTATSPEQTFKEEFEVLSEVVGVGSLAYCSVQGLRDEGVTATQASDTRLVTLIEIASRYIDTVTQRFFEPRQLEIFVDGKNTPDLLLGDPIIAVEEVEVVEQGSLTTGFSGSVDPSSLRVYNRHLSQGLVNPDDRENPKLSFLRDAAGGPRPLLGRGFEFPRGVQNIRVKGVFGYTERDGSPTGRTPLLIREVCKKLVIRDLKPLADPGRLEDQQRGRLSEEKTRDQSYKLEKLHVTGTLTGDAEIDTILVNFKRPPMLGAA